MPGAVTPGQTCAFCSLGVRLMLPPLTPAPRSLGHGEQSICLPRHIFQLLTLFLYLELTWRHRCSSNPPHAHGNPNTLPPPQGGSLPAPQTPTPQSLFSNLRPRSVSHPQPTRSPPRPLGSMKRVLLEEPELAASSSLKFPGEAEEIILCSPASGYESLCFSKCICTREVFYSTTLMD